MNVFIWGTGTIATEYLQCGELGKNEILGFIETQKSKDYFEEKKVYEPNEIIGMQYDYIIVCVHGYEREIYQTAMELGLDLKKLILLNNWEWADGENIYTSVPACCRVISSYDIQAQSIFPILYKKFIEENDIQARRYIAISQNGFDLVDDKLLTTKNSFAGINYQTDYFRYRTFELLANEIIQNKIEGSVAEVGVFRGAFSRLINAKFPKKTLLILMDQLRRVWAERVFPGSLHYIPGGVAHRMANTGNTLFSFAACWPSDAGHNYREIADHGFAARLLEVDGKPQLIGV